ncbi:putative ABC transporter permease protein [Actinoplanes missouriensis 431]|uniref:Putative ABC transporter permease protein n=1 Tax=Actinoplanes missouriensis (strain ATCC 14538 / DSM 43046 / CBS 188.64 / JCM 3121 / NBRC 102363 / NCIMB 12654 / NRRL B-3342 / UNCC 431) TaxID=512565 RepID=I0H3I2_ACTM4|nr:sugar ABC transporter permease [Actinoplanes missouriensis]BAL87569.1 putative ABC transporter permease protein [Actinoplanes missouriensis 431]
MRHGRWRFLLAALGPALALHVVFVLSPYAQAFYLSLTDWTGVAGAAHYVGVDNFVRLGGDGLFLDAVRNNAVMLLVVPAATIAVGLFLANMLSTRKGSTAYQIVYFFPQMLSLVIIAVLWGFVYNPNTGLLNSGLRALGLSSVARSWLAEPSLALPAVMAVIVWSSVGFYVVLFRAAIDGIPRELFEAARLDGAGEWATFRGVTLPLVRESVQVAFVYLGIVALDGFVLVQVMTVGPGGPDGATEVVGLSLYRTAFTYGKFGYATAMGVALFFAALTFAVLALRWGRDREPA